MPPVIEFNEKAKPKLAPAFGGKLQLDHYYQLRSASVIQIISPEPGECPNTWVKGVYINGPDEGCTGWWYENGLYQGKEYSSISIHHVHAEVDKPAVVVPAVKTNLVVKIGGVYTTKSGFETQPMVLHSAFDGQVNGPVFRTYIVNDVGVVQTSKCFYNQKGGYLGLYSDQLKVIPASNRNLVAEVEKKEEKILSKDVAKQLWMNGVKLMYKGDQPLEASMPWMIFPKNGPELYTEHWFDMMNHLIFKVG